MINPERVASLLQSTHRRIVGTPLIFLTLPVWSQCYFEYSEDCVCLYDPCMINNMYTFKTMTGLQLGGGGVEGFDLTP